VASDATAEAVGLTGEGERPRSRRGLATFGLVSAPVGWLALFFVVPVILVGLYSVGLVTLLRYDVYMSLQPWKDFLASDVYTGLFWKSVRMSLYVSVSSVALAYPVAYFLALVAGKRKYTLLLVIIVPFLTSYLLRVLAWRVILGGEGVVNTFLRAIDVIGPADQVSWLFYSPFATYLVLAYVWVPFVALPIFVSLESLDLHLLEASSDLGASRWRTFWTVTFPLSLPGVIAAFVFVLIPTLGEYITPQLVGGKNGYMFGNAIQSAFLQSFDWQFGSAMAMFLIAAVVVLTVIFGRYLNPRTVTE
jgi:spermidine/putrescine transport system permease protein